MAVSPECFYLLIDGEQRGPYTVKQIDHLLNSGLIREDATFWREGLEQWQPVTNLVQLRRPKSSWLKRGLMLGAGVTVVGDRRGDLENSFRLDGYHTVDATIRYAMTEKLEAVLTAQNLFDRTYMEAAQSRTEVAPGAPQTFIASLRTRF